MKTFVLVINVIDFFTYAIALQYTVVYRKEKVIIFLTQNKPMVKAS